VTTAKTAISKKFNRSRAQWSNLRCLIVMGLHLAWMESDGENFDASMTTLLRVYGGYSK